MKENQLKEKLELIFHDDHEQIEEYITFFMLINKLGKESLKKIYSQDIFDRKLKILNSINAFGDYEKETGSSFEKFQNLNLISIEWIRYFIILAETGSFDVAAHKLDISTRTLQRAISGIENILKLELIIGKNYFKSLTYAGKIFLEKARNINQILSEFGGEIDSLSREKETITVNLAWPYNLIEENILIDIISKQKSIFPNIYYRIFSMVDDTEKWIENGEIDIALALNKPTLKSIEYYTGKQTPYIIIGKPQKKRHWEELKYFNIPIEHKNNENSFHKIFADKFISEVDFSLMLYLCEAGLGAGFVPEIAVKNRIGTGTLGIIADPPLEKHEIPYILWNKNISMKKYISSFINELKERIS